MASYSALDPVSVAVHTALNVAGLTVLAPGGVGDDIAQFSGYPAVLYEVQESNLGGMGTRPGSGKRTLEIDVRVHVFSQYAGFYQAQLVMAKCIELLATAPVVTGYESSAIFHDDTIPLASEMVAGVRVNELVGIFRLYVSEAS